MESQKSVHTIVDHFFRRKAGQLTATLTRFLGPGHIDLAESLVQEALLKACESWSYRGIPENPDGWITTVAKNLALDLLRREKRLRAKEQAVIAWYESLQEPATEERESKSLVADDQLRMMFLCCHPSLTRKAQVALTLKTVGGFSVSEIARALLSNDEAIRRLLSRAKETIRASDVGFELPSVEELSQRLDAVLDVIYLIFNEGYSASSGEALIRGELCDEAIRLAELLMNGELAQHPRISVIQALLALMFLQSSRFHARTDEQGDVVLLADQNRTQWDTRRIMIGLERLKKSASGDEVSAYHLQAQIAASHATAASYETADWTRILELYTLLATIDSSAVVLLNRAVAFSMVHGPSEGLKELDRISGTDTLSGFSVLPATYADFHSRLGNRSKAAEYYRQAHEIAKTPQEKRLLEKKILDCSESGQ